MKGKGLSSALVALLTAAALGLSGGAPARAVGTNVESCSFAANGGTLQQHLTVSLGAGESAAITYNTSPVGGTLVQHNYGFVPKPNTMDPFAFAPYGSTGEFTSSSPIDLQGNGSWTISDSAATASWQGYDVSFQFSNYAYSPQNYFYVYRYHSATAPYALLCSVIVDYTPGSPVVTAGTATGGTAIATDANSDGVWDLVATPASGYLFTSWSCDNSQTPTSSSLASTTITPTTSTTCTPVFSVQSGINHGHSDKTAGSGDRSRGDYSSSPPSGQKPRKN